MPGYYNTGMESRTPASILTVGVVVLEHLTSDVVLKLFRPAKSIKSIKTTPLFVGVMRLVTGLNERKERLQLTNIWSM